MKMNWIKRLFSSNEFPEPPKPRPAPERPEETIEAKIRALRHQGMLFEPAHYLQPREEKKLKADIEGKYRIRRPGEVLLEPDLSYFDGARE